MWREGNVGVWVCSKVVGWYGVLEGICGRGGFAGGKQEVFGMMGIGGLLGKVV